MYQSFEAIVEKGKIRPLEVIKLKDSARVLVTVIDSDESEKVNWNKIKKWISRQRKEKKYTSYNSVDQAKLHLKKLQK